MGHTFLGRSVLGRWAVHPHIRGAYIIRFKAETLKLGSSPHTWGIQKLIVSRLRSLRFIPTYVGHTQQAVLPKLLEPVHPHIRGAYSVPSGVGCSASGSSPHTWGILKIYYSIKGHGRFIPTYVGHTPNTPEWPCPPPVHPHIRGAYYWASSVALASPGSSPHTWGILVNCSNRFYNIRFIPTYVGHTQQPVFPELLQPVHPHIRGAYSYAVKIGIEPFGSSPHTWGILSPGDLHS